MINVLWGIGGILCLIGIAWLISSSKKEIKWRTILIGLVIQLGFAFLVLKTTVGKVVLGKVSDFVSSIMGFTNEGINFLFGGLLKIEGVGMIFAFQVLPTIIFFSAITAGLYHLGIMQKVVSIIGGGLSKLLGTSKVESINSAANIFLGQSEAPLIIKPYIAKMSTSELFAVMVGGLASVAGSTLVGYAMLGVPIDYLIAASFMSAPAGLIMAKLIMPETEKRDKNEKLVMEKADTANIFDAIAGGASSGLSLAVNVGAMLLAFIAIIAMLNAGVGFVGSIFGMDSLSIELILGYIFAPLAFVIGVPFDEAVRAASFIGQKLVVNEFVAFTNFAPVMEEMTGKTAIITSFALTGFANFSCIGILLGGLGGMAPTRRKEIAHLGMKAVFAATLANLLSAAIAGMMF